MLVAVTLAVAAVAIMDIVRADLLASAEETLDLALAEQAAELGLVGDQAVLTEGFDAGFGPVTIDGRAAELGLFTQEEANGLAYGDVLIDGELVAQAVLDPVLGEVIALIDPITSEEIEDPAVLAAFDDLLFSVYAPDVVMFEEVDAEPLPDGELAPLLVGATPLDEIEASIDALQRALTMIVPLLVLCFAALTWWLVGRTLRPVLAITGEVEAISTSSLDRRVPVPRTGDEVSELATVMNRMLTRLQRGGERQRQFSADASHELRSPLATIRASAELIGRRADPERAGRLANEILAETDRMDRLIGDLLHLARIDEDRALLDPEPVDLVEVARREIDRRRHDPDIDAELVVGDDPVIVSGIRPQLERLLTNLVDNACRHAERRVVITVSAGPDGPSIVVDDDGPGVPEGREGEIFERFSRADESRRRQTGGSGLGLALVRSIADRHGATVGVGRSPDGGARFTVRFTPR